MKMMDEVAGIVAFRHCKTNVVTASIGEFTQPGGNTVYAKDFFFYILNLNLFGQL